MKIFKGGGLLSLLLLTLLAVSPAVAAEVYFSGSTLGAFTPCSLGDPGANTNPATCTPGAYGSRVTEHGLTYESGTFAGQSSRGFLGIGGGGKNFGRMTLNTQPVDYFGDLFTLQIIFTDPLGISGTGQRQSWTGEVSGNVGALDGGIYIDFDNSFRRLVFESGGPRNGGRGFGSFLIAINDVTIYPGQTLELSGTIRTASTVPEPSTFAMFGLGFVLAGTMFRRFRR